MNLTMNQSAILAQNVFDIKRLGKRATEDIIQIGKLLTECKEICGHGNWEPWLEREFKWSKMTATRYMNVYEMSKTNKLLDLEVPISGLMQLAAPSVSDETRNNIIVEAKTKRLTGKEVKQVIKAAKSDKIEKPEKTESKPVPDKRFESKVINLTEWETDQRTKDLKDELNKLKGNKLTSVIDMDDEGCKDCKQHVKAITNLRTQVEQLIKSKEIDQLNIKNQDQRYKKQTKMLEIFRDIAPEDYDRLEKQAEKEMKRG